MRTESQFVVLGLVPIIVLHLAVVSSDHPVGHDPKLNGITHPAGTVGTACTASFSEFHISAVRGSLVFTVVV